MKRLKDGRLSFLVLLIFCQTERAQAQSETTASATDNGSLPPTLSAWMAEHTEAIQNATIFNQPDAQPRWWPKSSDGKILRCEVSPPSWVKEGTLVPLMTNDTDAASVRFAVWKDKNWEEKQSPEVRLPPWLRTTWSLNSDGADLQKELIETWQKVTSGDKSAEEKHWWQFIFKPAASGDSFQPAWLNMKWWEKIVSHVDMAKDQNADQSMNKRRTEQDHRMLIWFAQTGLKLVQQQAAPVAGSAESVSTVNTATSSTASSSATTVSDSTPAPLVSNLPTCAANLPQWLSAWSSSHQKDLISPSFQSYVESIPAWWPKWQDGKIEQGEAAPPSWMNEGMLVPVKVVTQQDGDSSFHYAKWSDKEWKVVEQVDLHLSPALAAAWNITGAVSAYQLKLWENWLQLAKTNFTTATLQGRDDRHWFHWWRFLFEHEENASRYRPVWFNETWWQQVVRHSEMAKSETADQSTNKATIEADLHMLHWLCSYGWEQLQKVTMETAQTQQTTTTTVASPTRNQEVTLPTWLSTWTTKFSQQLKTTTSNTASVPAWWPKLADGRIEGADVPPPAWVKEGSLVPLVLSQVSENPPVKFALWQGGRWTEQPNPTIRLSTKAWQLFSQYSGSSSEIIWKMWINSAMTAGNGQPTRFSWWQFIFVMESETVFEAAWVKISWWQEILKYFEDLGSQTSDQEILIMISWLESTGWTLITSVEGDKTSPPGTPQLETPPIRHETTIIGQHPPTLPPLPPTPAIRESPPTSTPPPSRVQPRPPVEVPLPPTVHVQPPPSTEIEQPPQPPVKQVTGPPPPPLVPVQPPSLPPAKHTTGPPPATHTRMPPPIKVPQPPQTRMKEPPAIYVHPPPTIEVEPPGPPVQRVTVPPPPSVHEHPPPIQRVAAPPPPQVHVQPPPPGHRFTGPPPPAVHVQLPPPKPVPQPPQIHIDEPPTTHIHPPPSTEVVQLPPPASFERVNGPPPHSNEVEQPPAPPVQRVTGPPPPTVHISPPPVKRVTGPPPPAVHVRLPPPKKVPELPQISIDKPPTIHIHPPPATEVVQLPPPPSFERVTGPPPHPFEVEQPPAPPVQRVTGPPPPSVHISPPPVKRVTGPPPPLVHVQPPTPVKRVTGPPPPLVHVQPPTPVKRVTRPPPPLVHVQPPPPVKRVTGPPPPAVHVRLPPPKVDAPPPQIHIVEPAINHDHPTPPTEIVQLPPPPTFERITGPPPPTTEIQQPPAPPVQRVTGSPPPSLHVPPPVKRVTGPPPPALVHVQPAPPVQRITGSPPPAVQVRLQPPIKAPQLPPSKIQGPPSFHVQPPIIEVDHTPPVKHVTIPPPMSHQSGPSPPANSRHVHVVPSTETTTQHVVDEPPAAHVHHEHIVEQQPPAIPVQAPPLVHLTPPVANVDKHEHITHPPISTILQQIPPSVHVHHGHTVTPPGSVISVQPSKQSAPPLRQIQHHHQTHSEHVQIVPPNRPVAVVPQLQPPPKRSHVTVQVVPPRKATVQQRPPNPQHIPAVPAIPAEQVPNVNRGSASGSEGSVTSATFNLPEWLITWMQKHKAEIENPQFNSYVESLPAWWPKWQNGYIEHSDVVPPSWIKEGVVVPAKLHEPTAQDVHYAVWKGKAWQDASIVDVQFPQVVCQAWCKGGSTSVSQQQLWEQWLRFCSHQVSGQVTNPGNDQHWWQYIFEPQDNAGVHQPVWTDDSWWQNVLQHSDIASNPAADQSMSKHAMEDDLHMLHWLAQVGWYQYHNIPYAHSQSEGSEHKIQMLPQQQHIPEQPSIQLAKPIHQSVSVPKVAVPAVPQITPVNGDNHPKQQIAKPQKVAPFRKVVQMPPTRVSNAPPVVVPAAHAKIRQPVTSLPAPAISTGSDQTIQTHLAENIPTWLLTWYKNHSQEFQNEQFRQYQETIPAWWPKWVNGQIETPAVQPPTWIKENMTVPVGLSDSSESYGSDGASTARYATWRESHWQELPQCVLEMPQGIVVADWQFNGELSDRQQLFWEQWLKFNSQRTTQSTASELNGQHWWQYVLEQKPQSSILHPAWTDVHWWQDIAQQQNNGHNMYDDCLHMLCWLAQHGWNQFQGWQWNTQHQLPRREMLQKPLPASISPTYSMPKQTLRPAVQHQQVHAPASSRVEQRVAKQESQAVVSIMPPAATAPTLQDQRNESASQVTETIAAAEQQPATVHGEEYAWSSDQQIQHQHQYSVPSTTTGHVSHSQRQPKPVLPRPVAGPSIQQQVQIQAPAHQETYTGGALSADGSQGSQIFRQPLDTQVSTTPSLSTQAVTGPTVEAVQENMPAVSQATMPIQQAIIRQQPDESRVAPIIAAPPQKLQSTVTIQQNNAIIPAWFQTWMQQHSSDFRTNQFAGQVESVPMWWPSWDNGQIQVPSINPPSWFKEGMVVPVTASSTAEQHYAQWQAGQWHEASQISLRIPQYFWNTWNVGTSIEAQQQLLWQKWCGLLNAGKVTSQQPASTRDNIHWWQFVFEPTMTTQQTQSSAYIPAWTDAQWWRNVVQHYDWMRNPAAEQTSNASQLLVDDQRMLYWLSQFGWNYVHQCNRQPQYVNIMLQAPPVPAVQHQRPILPATIHPKAPVRTPTRVRGQTVQNTVMTTVPQAQVVRPPTPAPAPRITTPIRMPQQQKVVLPLPPPPVIPAPALVARPEIMSPSPTFNPLPESQDNTAQVVAEPLFQPIPLPPLENDHTSVQPEPTLSTQVQQVETQLGEPPQVHESNASFTVVPVPVVLPNVETALVPQPSPVPPQEPVIAEVTPAVELQPVEVRLPPIPAAVPDATVVAAAPSSASVQATGQLVVTTPKQLQRPPQQQAFAQLRQSLPPIPPSKPIQPVTMPVTKETQKVSIVKTQPMPVSKQQVVTLQPETTAKTVLQADKSLTSIAAVQQVRVEEKNQKTVSPLITVQPSRQVIVKPITPVASGIHVQSNANLQAGQPGTNINVNQHGGGRRHTVIVVGNNNSLKHKHQKTNHIHFDNDDDDDEDEDDDEPVQRQRKVVTTKVKDQRLIVAQPITPAKAKVIVTKPSSQAQTTLINSQPIVGTYVTPTVMHGEELAWSSAKPQIINKTVEQKEEVAKQVEVEPVVVETAESRKEVNASSPLVVIPKVVEQQPETKPSEANASQTVVHSSTSIRAPTAIEVKGDEEPNLPGRVIAIPPINRELKQEAAIQPITPTPQPVEPETVQQAPSITEASTQIVNAAPEATSNDEKWPNIAQWLKQQQMPGPAKGDGHWAWLLSSEQRAASHVQPSAIPGKWMWIPNGPPGEFEQPSNANDEESNHLVKGFWAWFFQDFMSSMQSGRLRQPARQQNLGKSVWVGDGAPSLPRPPSEIHPSLTGLLNPSTGSVTGQTRFTASMFGSQPRLSSQQIAAFLRQQPSSGSAGPPSGGKWMGPLWLPRSALQQGDASMAVSTDGRAGDTDWVGPLWLPRPAQSIETDTSQQSSVMPAEIPSTDATGADITTSPLETAIETQIPAPPTVRDYKQEQTLSSGASQKITISPVSTKQQLTTQPILPAVVTKPQSVTQQTMATVKPEATRQVKQTVNQRIVISPTITQTSKTEAASVISPAIVTVPVAQSATGKDYVKVVIVHPNGTRSTVMQTSVAQGSGKEALQNVLPQIMQQHVPAGTDVKSITTQYSVGKGNAGTSSTTKIVPGSLTGQKQQLTLGGQPSTSKLKVTAAEPNRQVTTKTGSASATVSGTATSAQVAKGEQVAKGATPRRVVVSPTSVVRQVTQTIPVPGPNQVQTVKGGSIVFDEATMYQCKSNECRDTSPECPSLVLLRTCDSRPAIAFNICRKSCGNCNCTICKDTSIPNYCNPDRCATPQEAQYCPMTCGKCAPINTFGK